MLLDIQKKLIGKGAMKKFKTLAKLKKDDFKIVKAELIMRKKEIAEAKKMNEIIKQSQTIVERFKNIFGGIWGEFTTQMSLAFGLDDRGPGSAMGKVEAFADQVKELLQLDTLAADIKGEGFLGAMEKRFTPVMSYIADAFGKALGKEWNGFKRIMISAFCQDLHAQSRALGNR